MKDFRQPTKTTRTYLVLGDSISISKYTGVPDGGAVDQLYARLQARQDGPPWVLRDDTYDGCIMSGVPLTRRPGGVDLITLTIAGNDLIRNMSRPIELFRPEFEQAYTRLLGRIQKLARHVSPDTGDVTEAVVIVGSIYEPDWTGPLWAFYPADQAREILAYVNGFIAQQVAAYGFRLADITAAFRGREAELLCYQIEPTLAGVRCIADLFEEQFDRAMAGVA